MCFMKMLIVVFRLGIYLLLKMSKIFVLELVSGDYRCMTGF